ncbi:hypothetical protein F4810DRAFT_677841 [Camillea tinctor]|nr:hypothetical protein F4810DRAFT_677841 [Camillea tinctor]
MHFSTLLTLILSTLLPRPATAGTDWAFTFYDSQDCRRGSNHSNNNSSSSSSSSSVHQNGTGDLSCAAVPGARLFGSVLGSIPAGSEGCAIHLFVDEGCGSRLAYGLTEHTNACAELGEEVLNAPLRSYAAVDCE